MAKTPWTRKVEFKMRPSDWGSGKIKHNWSAAGIRRRVAAASASNARIGAERQQRAEQQIIGFFRPGWPGFSAEERASMTSIARALHRNKIVTALGS